MKRTALPKEVPNDLKGALKFYLVKLAELLPATATVSDLDKFIHVHWNVHMCPIQQHPIDFRDDSEDPEVTKCRLWRYIYDHLAYETKVIGHWIQGQTRFCAMTLAFTGHGGRFDVESRGVITQVQYHVVHDLKGNFVEELSKSSLESQRMATLAKDHTVAEFLNEGVRAFVQTPFLTKFLLNGGCVQKWVETAVEHIEYLMKSSGVMVQFGETIKEVREMVQVIEKFRNNSQTKSLLRPKMLPGSSATHTFQTLLETSGDLLDPKRMQFGIPTASGFLLLQFLLCSRLSPNTWLSLLNFLSWIMRENRSSSALSNKIMVELFLHSVTSTVHASAQSWKEHFFTDKEKKKNKTKPAVKRLGQDIYKAILAISAIEDHVKGFRGLYNQQQFDAAALTNAQKIMRLTPDDLSDVPEHRHGDTKIINWNPVPDIPSLAIWTFLVASSNSEEAVLPAISNDILELEWNELMKDEGIPEMKITTSTSLQQFFRGTCEQESLLRRAKVWAIKGFKRKCGFLKGSRKRKSPNDLDEKEGVCGDDSVGCTKNDPKVPVCGDVGDPGVQADSGVGGSSVTEEDDGENKRNVLKDDGKSRKETNVEGLVTLRQKLFCRSGVSSWMDTFLAIEGDDEGAEKLDEDEEEFDDDGNGGQSPENQGKNPDSDTEQTEQPREADVPAPTTDEEEGDPDPKPKQNKGSGGNGKGNGKDKNSKGGKNGKNSKGGTKDKNSKGEKKKEKDKDGGGGIEDETVGDFDEGSTHLTITRNVDTPPKPDTDELRSLSKLFNLLGPDTLLGQYMRFALRSKTVLKEEKIHYCQILDAVEQGQKFLGIVAGTTLEPNNNALTSEVEHNDGESSILGNVVDMVAMENTKDDEYYLETTKNRTTVYGQGADNESLSDYASDDGKPKMSPNPFIEYEAKEVNQDEEDDEVDYGFGEFHNPLETGEEDDHGLMDLEGFDFDWDASESDAQVQNVLQDYLGYKVATSVEDNFVEPQT